MSQNINFSILFFHVKAIRGHTFLSESYFLEFLCIIKITINQSMVYSKTAIGSLEPECIYNKQCAKKTVCAS